MYFWQKYINVRLLANISIQYKENYIKTFERFQDRFWIKEKIIFAHLLIYLIFLELYTKYIYAKKLKTNVFTIYIT